MEGNQFTLILTRAVGTVVVALDGDVDASNSDEFRCHLDDVIDDESPLSMVVDLQGLGFMDSTGLGALVHALRRMRERGGDLTLSAPPPAARKLLGVSGLDRIFHVTRV